MMNRRGRVALLRDRDSIGARNGRAGARPSHLFVIAIGMALAGCGGSVKSAQAPAARPAAVGAVTLATPQELKALIDKEKGNVVVLNFWATWCPPCVKEMPEFAKFWREFDGKSVRFFSLSVDYAKSKDTVVVPFVKSYEVPFPVRITDVENPDDLTKELDLKWDNGALPATFIFGPDGKLSWQTIGGSITRDLLVEKVQPLIAKSPTATPTSK